MITATVNLPAPFYKWDGIKRTRKAAYTHYLTFYNKDYSNLSRRMKKERKSRAVRGVYYQKGRIYIFNPKMLSTPIPETIWDMWQKYQIPINSGQTMRFRRYNMKGEYD